MYKNQYIIIVATEIRENNHIHVDNKYYRSEFDKRSGNSNNRDRSIFRKTFYGCIRQLYGSRVNGPKY